MKKILIVDNHLLMLTFMQNFLEKEGYRVRAARSGLEALDVIKDFIPDVMFIDLIMPNIDGTKLCKIVRTMPEMDKTYLIIVSAIAAEEKERHLDFFEFGANACIAKGPFKKMKKHIRTALEHADQGISADSFQEIMGLEDVHIRTITQELLSGNQHYEVILNGMTEGIMEVTSQGRIVYANPAAIALTDMSEENLLASTFTGLFQESYRKSISLLLEEPSKTPRIVRNNGPVIMKDRQVQCKILPIQEGEYKHIVILNDITEQKERERQFLHAQKMEAIGTLAGGIAHDFNNLLMGIQGNISLILLNMNTEDPHHRRLEKIEELIEQGARLTSQLLGYAQEGRYEPRLLNLNELTAETSETFARTRKDITVHCDLFGELFSVEADRGQIEQVLLNLYVNASDAMPDGGKLHIKTLNVTHEHITADQFTPQPGNYALLMVSDTGIGMDDSIKERIFDPFFTTKEMGCSTGLGLASVFGIIKSHGGYIDVESQKGKGTTFKIYLPELSVIEKEQEAKMAEETDTPDRVITILLVDDEEHILEVGKEMLSVMGYNVLTAKSGNDAIEIYKKRKDGVDLVLLDMVMPSMGGSIAFTSLREINPDVKVLLSSGYSLDGEASEIMARGCNGFIQKPFRIDELADTVKNILKGKE
jgi:two-component system cell cycle sensor histidine kinase/response regulator CckA